MAQLHPIALSNVEGRCSLSNARNSDEQSFPGAAPRSVPLRAIWYLMYPVCLFGSPANQIAHPQDEPRGVITERRTIPEKAEKISRQGAKPQRILWISFASLAPLRETQSVFFKRRLHCRLASVFSL